ncbi:MAG: extracellular solute-binding protein, partial [Propionicimonas sp.]|nr:extracellular solute-binding protein [Propionicimonas sp.]
TPAATTGPTASTPPESTSAPEQVTLQYWSWAPNIEKIVAVWNQSHPNVQVEVNTSVSAGEIVAKLSAAKEAGNMPDVSNTTYEMLPNLVVNDIAADLTDAFASYRDKVAPAAWDLTTFGGQNYAVPQGTSPMFLFYRTDLFMSLGIEPPTTWDEYAAAAKKIHAADKSHYLATFPANDAQLFAALSQQAGAQWWSQTDGTWSVGINDAASKKVAEFWDRLVDDGDLATFKTWTPEWQAALADGTLASWISAVWAPPLILQNAPDTAGKWGAVQLPQWSATDTPVSGVLGGSGTIVTTGSKHPAEAREFAIWLNNSTEALTAYIENASIWPANLEGRTLPALRGTVPAALASDQSGFYDLAEKIDAITVPVTWGPDVAFAYTSFSDAFSQAITAKGSFTDALDTVQGAVIQDMTKTGFTLK